MSFNQVQIVGNCGGDPELRYTPEGTAVCNISLATNEKRKNKQGEMEDETTWFRCTLWGKQAENAAKYLAKGHAVFMQGRLRVDEWQSREGENRYTLEVNVDKMQFLPNSGQEKAQAQEQQQFTGQAPAQAPAQQSKVPAEFQ